MPFAAYRMKLLAESNVLRNDRTVLWQVGDVVRHPEALPRFRDERLRIRHDVVCSKCWSNF